MKKLIHALTLIISIVSFAQTKEEKVETIIKNFGYNEGFKDIFKNEYLKPLKEGANKTDSLKIIEIENKLTEKEIIKRLSSAYLEMFNENEINSIYSFYNSETGKKFINSNSTLENNFNKKFNDIFREINLIRENQYKKQDQQKEEIQNFYNTEFNKKDGFYLVTEIKDVNENSKLVVEENPSVEISDIKKAELNYDNFGNPIINVQLTEIGTKKFKILTAENTGKGIAIIVNKKVQDMPIINEEIPNGIIQISGGLTIKEAENLISKLKK